MRTKKDYQYAGFTGPGPLLNEAHEVAGALGTTFSDICRRSLVFALPALKKSIRHTVGIRRDTAREQEHAE